MSCAWEVTDEDVRNVLSQIGETDPTDQEVKSILGSLDMDMIEACALFGDSMEDQTEYAYREMRRQIEAGEAK